MSENKIPKMLSIRQVAKMGILSEYCLRKMEKNGELPCIHSGNKCLINVDKLLEKLNGLGDVEATHDE